MSNVLAQAMGGMNFTGLFSDIIFWVGYSMVGLLVLGVLVLAYYLLQFNMKANTWALYGSGTDGVFSIARKKWNRVRWINKKTAWRPLFPLFNRIELEPFDSEYIYPGKQIYAFILNGQWVPGRMNIKVNIKTLPPEEKAEIKKEVLDFLKDKYPDKKSHWKPGKISIDKSEEQMRAEINPVPHHIRNWQSLIHKKNAKEFAEHNFWEDNKYFFMVILTAILCLVMVGLTVYFTYKFATGGTGAMNNLADALRSFNTIPSIK